MPSACAASLGRRSSLSMRPSFLGEYFAGGSVADFKVVADLGGIHGFGGGVAAPGVLPLVDDQDRAVRQVGQVVDLGRLDLPYLGGAIEQVGQVVRFGGLLGAVLGADRPQLPEGGGVGAALGGEVAA